MADQRKFTPKPPPSDEEVQAFLVQHNIVPKADGRFDRYDLLEEIARRGYSWKFGGNAGGDGVEATKKERPGSSITFSHWGGHTAEDVALVLYSIIQHEGGG
jgi:hypothetical protein